MATTMQAYRILCKESPLLPDDGWEDPDQALRRLGVASGGEGVMIRHRPQETLEAAAEDMGLSSTSMGARTWALFTRVRTPRITMSPTES